MKKLEFTREQAKEMLAIIEPYGDKDFALAHQINAYLAEMLREAKVVEGSEYFDAYYTKFPETCKPLDLKRYYVIEAEEIKKECVEHEPKSIVWHEPFDYDAVSECRKCGVKIKAKWSVADE